MNQIDQRLEQLEEAMAPPETLPQADGQASEEASRRPGWMAPTDAGKQEQYTRYQKTKHRLGELHAENETRRSDKRKPLDKIVVSPTDPEAVFGLDKEKVYRPLYNVQTLSDVATDFVLAYDVFAQHSDSGTLQPLVNQARDSGVDVKDLLVDAGYPVGEDLAFCEAQDITLYAPWQENSFTAKKKEQSAQPCIEKDQFQWDESREVYVCPTGKTLAFAGQKTRQRANGDKIRFDLYQASPDDCTTCPLQQSCTKAPDKGRTVRRDPYQPEIDRLQARMQTEEAKKLYKQRGQTIERIFADFKEHRNLRRFRGRGITRARTQMGITVLGHNLRIITKLLAHREQESANAASQQNAA